MFNSTPTQNLSNSNHYLNKVYISLELTVVVVFLEFLVDTDPGVGELQGDPEPEQGTVLPDQFD